MSSSSPPSTYRLAGQVIGLSGASSGIGVAIAEALYQEGAQIIIGARRVDRLQQVVSACQTKFPNSPGTMIVCSLDVTNRQSVLDMVQMAKTQFHVASMDAMVCCAGVMYLTKMKNAKFDEWDEMIHVNCKGVTNCFGAILPDMVTAGKGRMVTISSDAGVRDFANLAVYCASKRFVETLTEITRRELIGTGVTLSTIQPGDVQGTELVMKNTDSEAGDALGVQFGKPYGQGFTRNQLLDAANVADAVIYVLTAPSHVSINSILIEARDQA